MNQCTAETLCGGIPLPNEDMERLSTFEFSTTPIITDYWHRNDPYCEISGWSWGEYFLKAPSKGESMDYWDLVWWYSSGPLVYGEVEYFWNQYNSYNHQVLAQEWSRMWDIWLIVRRILSKSSIKGWIHRLQRVSVVVFLCPIGIWRGWVLLKSVQLLESPSIGTGMINNVRYLVDREENIF